MNVVSFGGGTNSTAMIVGMYLHKIPVDLILFADPGAEQPHTYEYIEVFDEWLVKHGLPKITAVNCVDKDGNRLSRAVLTVTEYGFTWEGDPAEVEEIRERRCVQWGISPGTGNKANLS